MKLHRHPLIATTAIFIAALSGTLADSTPIAAPATTAKPALTVTVGRPQALYLPHTLKANGNVAAWQEAIIGNETEGLRLLEVRVNVGDKVKRGQVLATFASDRLAAEAQQIQAEIAGAKARLAEATANAKSGRSVKGTGALSAQQINQYLIGEKTAKAQLEAYEAAAKMLQVRLAQTQVLASDFGVISARTATVGAVLPIGQELFRLIRQNRLEWRAEVVSADLALLKTGAIAHLITPDGTSIQGKVRMLAPTVDTQTRLGLVYVDLPEHPNLKAGMFVEGQFELGNTTAITVPQQAVVLRDGFSYVYQLNPDQHVTQLKVQIGRRHAGQLEILAGLPQNVELVTSGVGFLNDGDLVKVVGLANAEQSAPTN